MKPISLILITVLVLHATTALANTVEHYPFDEAVQRAVADGVLDGSVTFHLSGNTPTASVIKANVVTNKKTYAFLKRNTKVCDHVLRSALIQLQHVAKQNGATQVGNIVSYFKKQTYRSDVHYECHVGVNVAGVALKGDLLE